MPDYDRVRLITYGVVTSTPTQVLPDGQANDFREDLFARGRAFCAAADWVADEHADLLADPRTLILFVAPEFYFRYGGPSTPATALRDSYPDGEQLLPALVEEVLKPHFADERFADWVVVAGSAFWHKSATDSADAHPNYFNTTLVVNGGPDTALSPTERAANTDVRALATVGASSTNQKALMSHLDYAIGVDYREWDAGINPMFRPVYGDADTWRWHTFAVHGVNGPQGKPVVFGLEVCLEHVQAYAGQDDSLGVLRSMELVVPDQPEIDLHVVTSCGMSLDPRYGVTARVGGHAMLCDGMRPASGAPWPTADCRPVIAVDADGARQVGRSAAVEVTAELPEQLQLGVPGETHQPRDAIALWEPVALPA